MVKLLLVSTIDAKTHKHAGSKASIFSFLFPELFYFLSSGVCTNDYSLFYAVSTAERFLFDSKLLFL